MILLPSANLVEWNSATDMPDRSGSVRRPTVWRVPQLQLNDGEVRTGIEPRVIAQDWSRNQRRREDQGPVPPTLARLAVSRHFEPVADRECGDCGRCPS